MVNNKKTIADAVSKITLQEVQQNVPELGFEDFITWAREAKKVSYRRRNLLYSKYGELANAAYLTQDAQTKAIGSK